MFKFPFTNFHELNLDWILSVVKTAQGIFESGQTDINHAVSTAEQALAVAEQAASATIADGAVTTPKIADEAVTAVKMAPYSVTSLRLADNAVERRKIADRAVNIDKLDSELATRINKIDHFEQGNIIVHPDFQSANVDSVELYKTGNTVFIAFRLTGLNQHPYGRLCTLPEGFKPARVGRVFGYYMLSSGTHSGEEQVTLCNITVEGTVTMYATQSENCSFLGVCGSYSLL